MEISEQNRSQSPVTRRLLLAVCGALMTVGLFGCGSSDDDQAEPDISELLENHGKRHDPINFEEIDLGQYQITRLNDKQQTLHIRFQLFGVVHKDKMTELKTAVEARGHIMRDSVISTVKSTELDHLNHPTLEWVRRQLIPAVNHSLQTRELRNVVFTEFELEEPLDG